MSESKTTKPDHSPGCSCLDCKPFDKPATTKDGIEKRIQDHGDFLRDEHPEVFTEQKHLDEGSSERAYWHYGYMVALRDVKKQMDDAECQKKQ